MIQSSFSKYQGPYDYILKVCADKLNKGDQQSDIITQGKGAKREKRATTKSNRAVMLILDHTSTRRV